MGVRQAQRHPSDRQNGASSEAATQAVRLREKLGHCVARCLNEAAWLKQKLGVYEKLWPRHGGALRRCVLPAEGPALTRKLPVTRRRS